MTARTDPYRAVAATPAEADEPIVTTRVDHGHEFSPGGTHDPKHTAEADDDVHSLFGAMPMAADADELRAQLETQALQLGRRLDARQAELDTREEELNRRLAEFDQQMRRSRLWLEERRHEIEEREVETGARRADLEARLDRILQHEQEIAARRGGDGSGAVAQAELDGPDHGRAADSQDDDVPSSAFEPRIDAATDSAAAARSAAELDARYRRLEEAEALLAAEQQALAEARRQFDADRAADKEVVQAERRAWAEERSRQQDALCRRHEKLRERASELDARAESLERLQRDLTSAQRETLEMRVAVQEMWLQLCGRAAPATLLQSLAETRAKLAAQYRHAGGEFDAAEKRLRAAAAELAAQLAEIKEQRRQFQTWADERQAAIERQAARLVAREQELDAQEERYRQSEQSWNEQRLAYRRQIRRLLAELRTAERGQAAAGMF